MNFDRCTGDFSKYHFYNLPQDSTLFLDWPSGTTFSPNDSFLYASTSYKIFQFDIHDTSSNSIQFIRGPDVDSANEFFQEYSNLYLGGDDRLYIGNFHGVKSTMSYIENPNRRGTACNFCRRCLKIPNNNAKGLPNMPYYYLGKKIGSVCDTIKPPTARPNWGEMKIYPNPTSGGLTVFLPLQSGANAQLVFYNSPGQVILKQDKILDVKQEMQLDISNLAVGVYHLRVVAAGQFWNVKVVKEVKE